MWHKLIPGKKPWKEMASSTFFIVVGMTNIIPLLIITITCTALNNPLNRAELPITSEDDDDVPALEVHV